MGRGIRTKGRRGGEEGLEFTVREERSPLVRDFSTPSAQEPAGGEGWLRNDPVSREIRRMAEEYDASFPSPSVLKGEAQDFMTGGNGTSNEKARYLTQEVLRILEEEHGICLDPAEVRREVHDELARHKVNDGREHNTNVLEGDFREVVDHVVAHFGGRGEGLISRVIESSEDMNGRIEDLIEAELASPENAALWETLGVEAMEDLRATLRTRLHSEFSFLLNEWGVERLEDVSEFLRDGIVADFEFRSFALISEAIASSAVCQAAP